MVRKNTYPVWRRNFHVHRFSRLKKKKKLIYVIYLCGCISKGKIFKTTLTFIRGQTLSTFFFFNESAVPSPVWVCTLKRESINTCRTRLWEPRTKEWFETIVSYTQGAPNWRQHSGWIWEVPRRRMISSLRPGCVNTHQDAAGPRFPAHFHQIKHL